MTLAFNNSDGTQMVGGKVNRTKTRIVQAPSLAPLVYLESMSLPWSFKSWHRY
jgi:hypothetical protein